MAISIKKKKSMKKKEKREGELAARDDFFSPLATPTRGKKKLEREGRGESATVDIVSFLRLLLPGYRGKGGGRGAGRGGGGKKKRRAALKWAQASTKECVQLRPR